MECEHCLHVGFGTEEWFIEYCCKCEEEWTTDITVFGE